ncbi:ANTAR domain-containing protein [Streptomyces sp. VRA16 Mangrove soil]|nr:ANTAR domain-containing protein [Streptomyces sp. VRA16 Mangrove soil]
MFAQRLAPVRRSWQQWAQTATGEVARAPQEVADVSQPDGRCERIGALQDEIRQLQQAIASHAIVDQAIGVMIALGGLTPNQGWHVLKTVSQQTNIKLRHIAERIVAWTTGHPLDTNLRHALDLALTKAANDEA